MGNARLDRRPEARAFIIEDILELAASGRIRVPSFQRGMKWRTKHVVELFDSVYRGFPVGELLLWKRAAPAEALRFGPYSVEADDVSDAYYVVDGQQRITALVGARMHPDETPTGDMHAVWFDLEEEKFDRLNKREAPPAWIPLNVIADSHRLLAWLDKWPYRKLRRDLFDRAIALGKSIREYRIPAYIVSGSSQDILSVIFKHEYQWRADEGARGLQRARRRR